MWARFFILSFLIFLIFKWGNYRKFFKILCSDFDHIFGEGEKQFKRNIFQGKILIQEIQYFIQQFYRLFYTAEHSCKNFFQISKWNVYKINFLIIINLYSKQIIGHIKKYGLIHQYWNSRGPFKIGIRKIMLLNLLPWYEIEMVWEYYLKPEDTFPGFDTHDYLIWKN